MVNVLHRYCLVRKTTIKSLSNATYRTMRRVIIERHRKQTTQRTRIRPVTNWLGLTDSFVMHDKVTEASVVRNGKREKRVRFLSRIRLHEMNQGIKIKLYLSWKGDISLTRNGHDDYWTGDTPQHRGYVLIPVHFPSPLDYYYLFVGLLLRWSLIATIFLSVRTVVWQSHSNYCLESIN